MKAICKMTEEDSADDGEQIQQGEEKGSCVCGQGRGEGGSVGWEVD